MAKFPALGLFILLCFSTLAAAAEYPDQSSHQSCSYCGMDRVKFAHSRMLIDYTDGSQVGTCSLHCAAVEFAISIDRTLAAINVADFDSGQLLDAESAVWVIGGRQPGVMTSRAKWAFADQADADRFIAEHGGSLGTFDQAMKAAYEDMYQDTLMIRNKRKMKMLKMHQHPSETE